MTTTTHLAFSALRRWIAVAAALTLGTTLSGCGVVAVAGATAGAAISVAGAVVSTGVKVTGKVIEKTIDAVTPAAPVPEPAAVPVPAPSPELPR